ncbi:E3 ubiquitin-protein ligase RNF25 [Stomoxys calcitrans]|uniref:RWD domain-containing protein n=1 Tax=Stomoxys calcitrans TaxID=35570 RepID=A0A1I8NX45_STOCA|nr:E3 ubiquitin-protein ligase RNF25 [Stomoxys calcitrans]
MDALFDEVESLEAILMDDVLVERDEKSFPKLIETVVFPLVGEDTDQQYVCVTLQVLPTPGYPDTSPEYKLIRPRGLDDLRLTEIKSAIDSKLKDSVGFPVVFDLIEVVREHLTGSNLPSGQCVVCLYGFCDGDEFTRTDCFHYLHSYCLGRHLNALRRNYQEEYNKLPAWQQKVAKPFQAHCPVCRENITDESDSLRCAMPPSDLENAPDFQPSPELRELQNRMSSLFLHQKSRGAIIDSEAEGGAIISIETEQEMRSRLQRKQEEAASAESSECSASNINVDLSGCCSSGSATLETAQLSENQQKDANGSSVKTTFAPVVQQTQRDDPTNNNYHHGRRHFRGGRRHHNYHHHQHQSQRDRERFEHNHIPSTSTSAAAAGNSHSHSSASQNVQSHHKQGKAHAAGHGHSR